MPILHKTENEAEFVNSAAGSIRDFIVGALRGKKTLRIALSGGESPLPVYAALAADKQIDWSRVHLFLADERYVPLNSNESNYGKIEKTLVSRVKNLRRFYHMNTREEPAKLASLYDALLKQQDSPLFDLVILGLGADGHTASLFPHSAALLEKRRLVAVTQKPGPDPQTRLTLTFPALLDSAKIIFLIRGKEKEPALARWLGEGGTVDETPAKGVLSHPDIEIFTAP